MIYMGGGIFEVYWWQECILV